MGGHRLLGWLGKAGGFRHSEWKVCLWQAKLAVERRAV